VRQVVPADVEARSSSTYRTMWTRLASQNGGRKYRVQSTDDPDDTARSIAVLMDPSLTGADSSPSGAISPEFASLAGEADACADTLNPRLPSAPPPEDGLHAPGIVINDGTYQEVVQFFQRGVRLKYAKLFGTLNLSSGFHRIRVIGRRNAIAVYGKEESEKEFKRLIFSQDGLSVRSVIRGDVEWPDALTDASGVKHAVWAEAPRGEDAGRWVVNYTRTKVNDLVANGLAGRPDDPAFLDLLAMRVAFLQSEANLPTSVVQDVLVASHEFTRVVREGDKLVIREFLDENGRINRPMERYVVAEVLSDISLRLESADSRRAVTLYPEGEGGWTTAVFSIYRGDEAFVTKTPVSIQTLDAVEPSLLAHSDGEVYVAYSSNDAGAWDVHVRRGEPGDNSTGWRNQTRVTRGSGHSRAPRMTEANLGRILVAWQESRLDLSRSQIFYAVIDPDDLDVKADIRRIDDDALLAANPQPLRVTDEEVLVFYEDDLDRNGENAIYVARISLVTDKVVGSPVALVSGGDNRQVSAAISSRGVTLAWRKEQEEEVRVWTMTIDPSDLSVLEEVPLTIGIGSPERPRVSVDDSNIYVIFEGERMRPQRPDVFVAAWDSTSGRWASSGQYGMDVRLLPLSDHDSFDWPVLVPDVTAIESQVSTGITAFLPRLYAIFRASETESDSEVLGTSFSIVFDDASNPINVILDFEDNAADDFVTNAAHLVGMTRRDGALLDSSSASMNTSDLQADDETPGFDDLDPGEKGYFDFSAGEGVRLAGSLMSEDGAVDVWMKPQFGPGDAGTHFLLGNAPYAEVDAATDPNTFALAYDGGGWNLALVDEDGALHKTAVSDGDFSWAQDDPIRLRAEWNAKAVGIPRINSLAFKDKTTGIACAPEGTLFKTTDGGATWSTLDLPFPLTYELYSVDYVAGAVALAGGEYGTILKSTDDGATWVALDSGVTADVLAVYYDASSATAWAVADGFVLKSTDLISWTQVLDSTARFLTVSVLGGVVLVGGVEDDVGVIYRSTDAGSTFAQATVDEGEAVNHISKEHFSSGTVTYAAADDGNVLITQDSGETWTRVTTGWTGIAPALYGISHVGDPSNTWYAVGSDGSFVRGTPDSFSEIETGLVDGAWRGVEARFETGITVGLVVAAGAGTSVMRSENGGIVQSYYTANSANLVLRLNGEEPTQTRTGDYPFSWDPTGSNIYVGGAPPHGESASVRLYQLVLQRAPALNETALKRKETWSIRASSGVPGSTDPAFESLSLVGKRVEWGSLSSKSRSHWKFLGAYPCAPVAPLRFYAWTSQLGIAGDLVNDLAFDRDGRLWIASGAGVGSLNAAEATEDMLRWEAGRGVPENSETRVINRTGLTAGLSSDVVTSIAADEDGDVWFGTRDGLGFLEATRSSVSATGDDPVQAPVEEGGPTVVDEARIIIDVDGLPSSAINVVRAMGERIYVGTDSGLSILKKTRSGSSVILEGTNLGEDDGLPSSLVRSIFFDEDNEETYVGTDRGLVRLALKDDVPSFSPTIIGNSVISGMTWNDGVLAGTTTGLVFIDSNNNQSQVSSELVGLSPILAQDVDGDGKVWLASASGLIRLDAKCGTLLSSVISAADGLLGHESIEDFRYYRLLADPIPGGGCEKAVVHVVVNGRRLSSGFRVVPHVPMLVFDEPRRASDEIEVFVQRGTRKVSCLDDEVLSPLAFVETTTSRLGLHRKRVLAGGTLVLGANKAGGAAGFPRMYAVFCVPVDPSAAPASQAWPISSVAGASATLVRPAVAGTSIYADSTDAISLLPSLLGGAQLVAFDAADSEKRDADYATLTAAADCIVYVAYDSRAIDVPSWLRTFEPVANLQRAVDMDVYTAPNGEERLYVGSEGTNGCVYGVLNDPARCDVTGEIAMDDSGPEGCISSALLTGATVMRLALRAEDAVTGVDGMKVSPRSDFKDADGNDLPWIPFSSSYDLDVPVTESTISEEVTELETGFYGSFFDWNGTLLATASTPGRVFEVPSGAGQGDAELLFDTGEAEVNSLLPFGQFLVVGTGTNGRMFAWDGTSLSQIIVPGAQRVTAFEAFENKLFIGASVEDVSGVPRGNVYTMTEDDLVIGNEPALFKQTLETEVTGFAIFGGSLFWSTANEALHASALEIPSSDIVLSTTTRRGHRHSFDVPAGVTLMSGLTGWTSEVDGHSHQVTNGVVADAQGHSHVLNGAMSGKVFRYDPVSDNVTIEHADRDFRVTSIASSTLDAEGLMFVGTHPNGKVLRYIAGENIFIKSFDTLADTVSRVRFLEGSMFALAGNDFFFFTGSRWEFLGSTGGDDVIDIVASLGNVFLLTDAKVFMVRASASSTTSFRAARNACAYVNFRDGLGNESDRFNADGTLKACYFACISDEGFSGTSGVSGVSGTSGVAGVDQGEGEPAVFHRITEVDEDAQALLSILGSEAFYSAKKVEREVGVYESEILNGTTAFVQWTSISWNAIVPQGTTVSFQVRSASTRDGIEDATWSAEMTGGGYPARPEFDISSQRGQFLQFRAILRATQAGVQSPELEAVFIQLRTSQAVHYYTTNFVLPDNLLRGILTWTGCRFTPTTDIVFGIGANDTTDFSDYHIIEPDKVFELPPEHRKKNLRVGIKLISDPQSVPIVDEFALMFSLANDAIIRLNPPGMPTATTTPPEEGTTRTVETDSAQGHVHELTFSSFLDQKAQVNGQTTINAGHRHLVVGGVIQPAAGHDHDFEF
jgi:photosystem II stability/assembly factor-like uncharacterized protein